MDSFELNKIMGAILGTLLFIMGVGFLAEAIYHPITGNGPGYALPVGEGADDGGTTETPEAPAVSIGTLLAAADPAAGQAAAKKCQACHDLSEANSNKTGPGLYDVVERVMGDHPGFSYSDAMMTHHAAGDTWTYENLDHFLLSPKGFMPGTKMTFAGVKSDQERADIIAYLSTLSASPKPFPAPDAAAEDAAPPADQVTDGTVSAEPEEATETPSTTDEPGAADEPAAEEDAPAAPEASSAAQ